MIPSARSASRRDMRSFIVGGRAIFFCFFEFVTRETDVAKHLCKL